MIGGFLHEQVEDARQSIRCDALAVGTNANRRCGRVYLCDQRHAPTISRVLRGFLQPVREHLP